MPDEKETPSEQVAPANDGTQIEQAAPAEKGATPPETASDKGEEKLYAGKFKSVEDLEKSYGELQSSFTKERQAMAQPGEQEPDPATVSEPYENTPQLEPEAEQAVRFTARNEFSRLREEEKEREFVSRHPELKEDKVLSGTLKSIFEEANRARMINPNVPFLNHEEALTQAEKLLDEKIKPVQKEASQEGFKEGKDVAKKKEQLGEVGSSNYREPEVDDKDLTAADFAKKHNIPRI